jgi:hypothetical protein
MGFVVTCVGIFAVADRARARDRETVRKYPRERLIWAKRPVFPARPNGSKRVAVMGNQSPLSSA